MREHTHEMNNGCLLGTNGKTLQTQKQKNKRNIQKYKKKNNKLNLTRHKLQNILYLLIWIDECGQMRTRHPRYLNIEP